LTRFLGTVSTQRLTGLEGKQKGNGRRAERRSFRPFLVQALSLRRVAKTFLMHRVSTASLCYHLALFWFFLSQFLVFAARALIAFRTGHIKEFFPVALVLTLSRSEQEIGCQSRLSVEGASRMNIKA
jgi:hypothetical protein